MLAIYHLCSQISSQGTAQAAEISSRIETMCNDLRSLNANTSAIASVSLEPPNEAIRCVEIIDSVTNRVNDMSIECGSTTSQLEDYQQSHHDTLLQLQQMTHQYGPLSSAADRLKEGMIRVSSICGADTSQPGFKDGLPSEAHFNHPHSVVELLDGTMLVADTYNNVLRRVLLDGTVVTLGESRLGAGYQDGHICDAQFNRPRGLCLTMDGRVLIADTGNHVVRELCADLTHVYTLAGRPGQEGSISGSPAESSPAFVNAHEVMFNCPYAGIRSTEELVL